MHNITMFYIIRDLFATAAGLLAIPAFILHLSPTVSETKLKNKIGLYILDAIVVILMLISIFY